MSRDPHFHEALEAMAERWDRFDPINTLILQAMEAVGETENRNLAVANMLVSWGKFELSPPGARTQRLRDADLDRLRKKIERLSDPDEILLLRGRWAFHDLSEDDKSRLEDLKKRSK